MDQAYRMGDRWCGERPLQSYGFRRKSEEHQRRYAGACITKRNFNIKNIKNVSIEVVSQVRNKFFEKTV